MWVLVLKDWKASKLREQVIMQLESLRYFEIYCSSTEENPTEEIPD